MKAKWDKEKEELPHQLEEKDKLRDANGKLIESQINILEQALMTLAGYRPYLDSMDSYFPKPVITNFITLYLVFYLVCVLKHTLMIFF